MAKTFPFGDIEVPSPGFGAMGLSFGLGTNLSLEEAEPVLLKAIELGCTFWDTAVRWELKAIEVSDFSINILGIQVVYAAGVNEKLLGEFIKKHNVRDKLFSEFLCFGLLPIFFADHLHWQSLRNADSTAWEAMDRSQTLPRTSRSISMARLRDLGLLLISITSIGLIPVSLIAITLFVQDANF